MLMLKEIQWMLHGNDNAILIRYAMHV